MDWLTAEEARTEPYWPGPNGDPLPPPEGEPDPLTALLTSAREQCQEYAPVLAEGADVPERYRLAQSLQARSLYRAGLTSGDSIGADGLTIPTFPMDWHVKALLRPRSGRPVVR